jgi:glycosyltransferase involved in cell wall biosynthesis
LGKGKICFINSCKAWGGGEKWHFDMALGLRELGREVLAVTGENTELAQRFATENIKQHSFKISNLSFLNPVLKNKISRILKSENVETVILNLPADLKTAGTAAVKAGVKRIIYRRGSAIPVRNTFFNRYLFKNIITDIIANSEETKRTLLKNNKQLFDENKIKVIYNGLDLKEYDSRPAENIYNRRDDEVILGNAGRLVEQKGHKYLLDIARLLKDRGYNFKLLIAGEGKLKTELERYAASLGVENEVIFLGFVKNIKSFMENIDIFLLTSKWEGFGYVITEAMASSLPVVAFNTSSNPEIIAAGETGFLAGAFDIPEFAKYVEKLISDRDLRENMGRAGRKRAEIAFDMSAAISELDKYL